jgi:lipopolysaccharide transport system ATP-binding protein
MGNKTIVVDKIAKRYRIGLKEEKQDTFVGMLFTWLRSPLDNYRRLRKLRRFGENEEAEDIIWAVRDISFSVNEAEIVGIIGSNGAGKSTLLKILSRITEPTSGTVYINGRVSSLLEVGTGFHPELTGRENIYLNGTLLGMKKAEIDRKIDEIVDFSGISKFIDTPIKRYSSGMTVRLAFSVAAHLEPEILIVDEVLAVGDAEFQRKCLNKMESVSKLGRTVLFVSHNMSAITRLCPRTILLNNGRLIDDGPTKKVVGTYLNTVVQATAQRMWNKPSEMPGNEIARLLRVSVKTEHGEISEAMDIREPIHIEMEYDILKEGYEFLPYYMVNNDEGVNLFQTLEHDPAWVNKKRPTGRYISEAIIPGNLLSEGRNYVDVVLITLSPVVDLVFSAENAITFQIMDSQDGDSARGIWTREMHGLVRPLLKWRTKRIVPKRLETHDFNI